MRITVLDASTLGEDLDLTPLKEYGDVTVFETTGPEEVAGRIFESETVILNKVKLTAQNLAKADHLKLICVAATGFDNIDLDFCRKKGIAVCNVVGYSTHCVAQITLTMALTLITNWKDYTEFVNSTNYSKGTVANRLSPVYHEICGKTWGIVGFGNIGKQVGTVARAMGCNVIVNKRTPIEGWDCVSLEELCTRSDIVSIHTPLNPETRNLINAGMIAKMKPSAIVINVARGAVWDESAVTEAILKGKIGGIGVDVYSQEPFPMAHPFHRILGLPNVCMTPHMAWGGAETRERLLNEIIGNIRSFMAGEKRNRVD